MSTVGVRYVRHWKEQFSLDLDLIFIKRLVLGLKEKHTALPGEDVTPSIREAIGPQRLKMWWRSRVVGSREYAVKLGLIAEKPAEVEEEEVVDPSAPLPKNIRPLKRGRFEVRLPTGQLQIVFGLEKALRLASGQ